MALEVGVLSSFPPPPLLYGVVCHRTARGAGRGVDVLGVQWNVRLKEEWTVRYQST